MERIPLGGLEATAHVGALEGAVNFGGVARIIVYIRRRFLGLVACLKLPAKCGAR